MGTGKQRISLGVRLAARVAGSRALGLELALVVAREPALGLAVAELELVQAAAELERGQVVVELEHGQVVAASVRSRPRVQLAAALRTKSVIGAHHRGLVPLLLAAED